VRRDSEGFIYFIGRRDEMIKTSGYRVSPLEVEEVLYATQLVGECVAFGVSHPVLGSAIQIVANYSILSRKRGDLYMQNELRSELIALCKARMPAYMVPAGFEFLDGPLPRNPNGKIDRKFLSARWLERHSNGVHSG
jgi:acyl-coenzyme A synthetase/AMP-(fatty) acid ligase